MKFRVLGPLEILAGERLVALPRRKHRALLAVLLIHAREPRSRDRLVDDLWGERAPANARGALHNYVSQLRAVIGAEWIVRDPAGYVLDVDDEQFDLGRFRRLVREARAVTDTGERARKAREALALWRGPPLPDLVYEPFAALELPLLEEERLSAYKELLDAELDLGRHGSVIDEIDALVRSNPYDERLRRQLMLALYRAGRQADALEVFRDARQMLVDELGIEPGRELRSLERGILEQDPAIEVPGGPPRGDAPSRKTVTILFAGLPEPQAALDPEALHARQRQFHDSVKAAVEYHGGIVERAGELAMAIFGVPAANEDDSLRAVRAAVALEKASNADAKLGIDTGEVYVEAERDGTRVSGDAMTTARRLEQRASPGEILLGAKTVRLVREAVKVAPAGRARSGAPEVPFRLVALEERAPDAGRRHDTPLIGRLSELAELRHTFGEARDGRRPRMTTVVGEAGIGKTRLARELVRELRSEATVLVGRCVSYGEGATYLPVAEMIAQAGGDLESIIGGSSSTGTERIALRGFFASVAAERPAVLVFEDIHWAEPTLLDLIEHLGERLDAPIFILCLARPDAVGRRSMPGMSIVLERLDDQQMLAFIRALGGSSDPDIAAGIVDIADGNPLYAEQLLAYVGETGTLESVPASLEALLASRFDRLGLEERQLLQRAALVGREFAPGIVLGLCPAELAGSIDALLERAMQAGFIEATTTRFRFHHILMRDVVYATLPKADRAELHEHLADLMGSAPDELVGHHLEQAARWRADLDPADGRAARLAVAAGFRLGAAGLMAWRRGDAPAAVNLLSRAAGLLAEDDPFRLELMCELGVALRGAGELRRAESVLDEAANCGARSRQRRFEARALLELENVRLFSDPGGHAGGLLEIAGKAVPVFEAVGDDHSLARAWRLTAFVEGAMRCRYAASAEAAERALAHESETGWSTAAILGDLGAALLYGPTPVPAAIGRCESLLDEADLGGEANLLPFLANLEAMRERFEIARTLLDRAGNLYAELGQGVFAVAVCSARRAEVELLAGNTGAAQETLQSGYRALERVGDRASLATFAAYLAEVLLRSGRPHDAGSWSRTAEELGSGDDVPTQFLVRAVRAKLLAIDGEKTKAEALAHEAAALSGETDSLSQRAGVMLDLAEVLRICGRHQPAAKAGEAALELYEEKGNLPGAGRARRFLVVPAPV
jgi:DNA-binding SARP family transcriptional activator